VKVTDTRAAHLVLVPTIPDAMPCPFCASVDLVYDEHDDHYDSGVPSVDCNNCGCIGPGKERLGEDPRQSAIEAWNLRVF